MKLLIQRVKKASVIVEKKVVGKIGRGLLLFVGIDKGDSGEKIAWLADKVADLRLFPRGKSEFDISVKELGAEILLVSQFTLCGVCAKGRRPDFIKAELPLRAKKIYDDFIIALQVRGLKVSTGIFGAYMQVKLENDGPVTFIVEK